MTAPDTGLAVAGPTRCSRWPRPFPSEPKHTPLRQLQSLLIQLLTHCGQNGEGDDTMLAQTENLWDDLLKKHSDSVNDWFDRRFDERFSTKTARLESEKTPSLSIMITKGTLDWAYPPFIIASTATALGWEVSMFFTFYGLALLKKKLALQISPLGNPAMPMHMPFGPKWFREVEWKIPNLIMAGVPGFEHMATAMMKKTIAQKGVAPIEELRAICIESGVKLIACQMTVDLFGWHREEFIPEIEEWAGAASYLSVARESRTNLLI